MNKIILSLSMIAFVAAIAIVGTTAYFSDTETSVGNTFTAGTIDIDIDNENPWTSHYDIGDLKPGEVGYINFQINNVGKNPVDVSKKLYGFVNTDSGLDYTCIYNNTTVNVSSEPEFLAEGGTFDSSGVCDNTGWVARDNVKSKILYDLSVEVYDAGHNKIWWQTIYAVDGTDDVSLSDVYGGGKYVALGMIPVDGYMLVTQSYHFNSEAGNKYQGDGLTFDMEILGEQLTGANGMATVVLENKTKVGDEWIINSTDNFVGTLEYETNGPEFVYDISGVAQLASHSYVLAIGYDAGTNVDTFVAAVTTASDGSFSTNGSIELSKDMMGVKAWLVPAENWNIGTEQVIWPNPWTNSFDTFLWETSFVWYNDTDI